MENRVSNSDRGLINLLQQQGPLGIPEIMAALHVTATAVRQRLMRLMNQGLIQRETAKPLRGRPSHRYLLTEKGRRQTAHNFPDLTIALWREVRAVKDTATRRGLLERLAKTMAEMYQGEVQGDNTQQRMQSISALMAERNLPFAVEFPTEAGKSNPLPVLTAHACPYPELAEQDRGICAVEKMLFTELLGENVRLSDCRLDGATCCRFETN